MTCPVTGEKECHCKCPGILGQIAHQHNASLDTTSDANREHFECMKSELCCDFTDQQFTHAHQHCTDQGKSFDSTLR